MHCHINKRHNCLINYILHSLIFLLKRVNKMRKYWFFGVI